jgi:hypothetical protein
VDSLPRETKEAMLEGIERNPIIVGAYQKDGGICPMLAAHRSGGRTNFAGFARAWDRYTDASRARSATERELLTLRTMLEHSLFSEDQAPSLTDAAAEFRARRRERSPEPATDRYRTPELRRRHGWAWTRIFRRYDHYEAAMGRLEQMVEQGGPEERANQRMSESANVR